MNNICHIKGFPLGTQTQQNNSQKQLKQFKGWSPTLLHNCPKWGFFTSLDTKQHLWLHNLGYVILPENEKSYDINLPSATNGEEEVMAI